MRRVKGFMRNWDSGGSAPFGKRLDVAWFEKEILSRSQCPQPFLSIQALPSEKLEEIIKMF